MRSLTTLREVASMNRFPAWSWKIFVISLCCTFLAIVSIPAMAACNPCAVSYAVHVHYSTSGIPQSGWLTGSTYVSDGTLDLNVGTVKGMLTTQMGSSAVLSEVVQVMLGGG